MDDYKIQSSVFAVCAASVWCNTNCSGCRHDFTVVETIDFYEDEEGELPNPLTLSDVKTLNKAEPFGEEDASAQDAATGDNPKAPEVVTRSISDRTVSP
jgi:hypothetical protein